MLITDARTFALTIDDLDPSAHYKLEKAEFSGQHAFSRDTLLSLLDTKERPWYQVWKARPDFDPQTFADDLSNIKRFYKSHGYYNAQETYYLTVNKDKVTAHITISEGQPVKVGSVTVKIARDAPHPTQLNGSFKLPLTKGDTFSEETYQKGAQNLLELYTTNSYAHAKVERHAIVKLVSLDARVEYDVVAGQRCVFGNTEIHGLKNVKSSLVNELLTYKPGESFDSRKLAQSRDSIVALNLFNAVEVKEATKAEDQSVVPITISVQEGPKHTVQAGIGYNTQTQLNAVLRWSDYNFLGGGRRLSIEGIYSNINSTLDVKLLQPRLFTPKLSLTLEASQQQQTYQTYTGNISGFDPHLDYKFSSSLSMFAGWRLEYMKFHSVNTSTINAIGGFRRDGFVSGPSAGMTFNNTEDPFNPQSGEIVSLTGNFSDRSLGADYRYWRLLSEARKYQSLGWKTVLATRIKVGLADTFDGVGNIPLSERFYSGGEGSVCGYGLRRIGPLSASNDPLGGVSLIEGSVELRRPLFWKLNGAVFFDCGQVATKPYDLRVDALQCGYGPALGISSPVGPINFYLGFPTDTPRNDSSWQFYFSIGQYF